MRPLRRALPLTALAVAALVGHGVGAALAAFSSVSSNAGNSFAAATDLRPPPVAASTLLKTAAGGNAGYLRQGETFHVYASVTDVGTPASGTASVTVTIGTIATTTPATLSTAACPCTVGGVTYNYRTVSSLTVKNPLADGTYGYTVATTDNAGNAGSTGFTAVVDNTAPSATDIQTVNVAGGTASHAETGDSVVFTFSDTMDPASILAGWTGAGTSVTVRLINGNPGNDSVQIWNAANSAQIPLGSVDLGGKNYVNQVVTFTNSTMTRSGAVITVVLGTPSAATLTPGTNDTMTWTPVAGPKDLAGNAMSLTPRTEGGAADTNF
jgi:hypothetical protein